jgi:trehalose/maltose hydrolase-like predicted phosphorylase
MIEEPLFPVEPWLVREPALDLDLLARVESVFALANGHLGCAATPTWASRTSSPAATSTASNTASG